jgi:hypothetical protein
MQDNSEKLLILRKENYDSQCPFYPCINEKSYHIVKIYICMYIFINVYIKGQKEKH